MNTYELIIRIDQKKGTTESHTTTFEAPNEDAAKLYMNRERIEAATTKEADIFIRLSKVTLPVMDEDGVTRTSKKEETIRRQHIPHRRVI